VVELSISSSNAWDTGQGVTTTFVLVCAELEDTKTFLTASLPVAAVGIRNPSSQRNGIVKLTAVGHNRPMGSRIGDTGFRPKSSATPFGSTIASRSAFAMSRTCSPSGGDKVGCFRHPVLLRSHRDLRIRRSLSRS